MRYLGKITDPKDLVNKEYVDDINTSIQAELDTKANTASVEAALDTKAPAIVNSASGTIASFTDGADNIPIKSATVQITPVQSGSGDPSPTNVRPISGWTGANIANISDLTKQPYFAGLMNGTYRFVDMGTLNWALNASYGMYTPDLALLIKKPSSNNDVSNLICEPFDTTSFSTLYDAGTSGRYIAAVPDGKVAVNTTQTDAATFKTAMSGVYLIYELATPTTPTITAAQFATLLNAFGLGGQLINVNWSDTAGTIYKGTLTYNGDGTWTPTATGRMIDMGSITCTEVGDVTSTGYYSYLFSRSYSSALLELSDIFANVGDKSAIAMESVANYSMAPNNNNGTIKFKCTDYADATAFKAAMSGHQLVIINATPVIGTPITTAELVTLLGNNNNVWADCGDTSVEYRADTKMYIDKQVANLMAVISSL